MLLLKDGQPPQGMMHDATAHATCMGREQRVPTVASGRGVARSFTLAGRGRAGFDATQR